jgi:glycosyltransferase involved in cell wall biosynthesis
MPKPIKILHCLGSLDPGGIEIWLLSLLKLVDTKRFQFDFCTFGVAPGLFAQEAEKLGSKVLACPRSQNLWAFRHNFREILRCGHYDGVHTHVQLFAGLLLRWAYIEGIQIRVAHSHNSHDGKSKTGGRRAYRFLMRGSIQRYATHGLAVSRLAADDVFLDWQHDPRIAILHCGIDLHRFRGPADSDLWRRKIAIPVDARVIGHVGNFTPAKNHGFILEIAAQVRKRRPDIHFLLIGDGPLRSAMEQRAFAMGLQGSTHFIGTHTDVPILLRTCVDAFVFPSLWEGLPLVLLEAQAAGLRCVFSTEITDEVVIIPDQVVQLPLSLGAEQWATTTIERIDRGRLPAVFSIEAMQQTDFTVEHGLSVLIDMYSAGKAGAPCR